MKKIFPLAIMFFGSLFIFVSCKKGVDNEQQAVNKKEVTPEVLAKIQKLGYGTQNVRAYEDGYIVEGDIFIPDDQLDASTDRKLLRVGDEEQYRTNNLVASTREITLKFRDGWTANEFNIYRDALNEAIARYNAIGIRLTFRRITVPNNAPGGTPNIWLRKVTLSGGFYAIAGFPTAAGNPYNNIDIDPNNINSQSVNFIASILTHEIGHCIGFRHTDYMNRAYSCGGFPENEGDAGIGAIHIPGTPTGPEPNSWMLACFIPGANRPFTNNDVTALNYLYGVAP